MKLTRTTPEPDVLAVAAACERAGAEGITVHLRADRRHIHDADVFRLRERLATKLNLEMGNTPEILEIALRVKPDDVCLVPENRREVTTDPLTPRHRPTPLPFPAWRGEKQIPSSQFSQPVSQ